MSAKRNLREHCDQLLTLPVFKRHKSMYFHGGVWNKEECQFSSDDEDMHTDHDGDADFEGTLCKYLCVVLILFLVKLMKMKWNMNGYQIKNHVKSQA